MHSILLIKTLQIFLQQALTVTPAVYAAKVLTAYMYLYSLLEHGANAGSQAD